MLWSKLYKLAVTKISSWGGKIISATPLTGHTEGFEYASTTSEIKLVEKG